jgi:RNA polymerase sigma-70 factor (ECF subfamily)
MENQENSQDELYRQAAATYGPALVRLARAWEADADGRQDLLQELHLALWRSMAAFDNRCSLRTWVYRVAQNAAISCVLRSRGGGANVLVSLEEIVEEHGEIAGAETGYGSLEQAYIIDRMYEMIRTLNPLDRQVILLYLEGFDAASIADVTGISSGYVATKIHRVKTILAKRFQNGGNL